MALPKNCSECTKTKRVHQLKRWSETQTSSLGQSDSVPEVEETSFNAPKLLPKAASLPVYGDRGDIDPIIINRGASAYSSRKSSLDSGLHVNIHKLYRSHSLPADSAHWNIIKNDPKLLEILSKESAFRGSRESWATVLQHYYPEGGWGWVVLGVSMFVAILCHGLHTGFGIILKLAIKRYGQNAPNTGSATESDIPSSLIYKQNKSKKAFLTDRVIAVCSKEGEVPDLNSCMELLRLSSEARHFTHQLGIWKMRISLSPSAKNPFEIFYCNLSNINGYFVKHIGLNILSSVVEPQSLD